MKTGIKQFTIGAKSAQGAEVTPEILAKINRFALKPLAAEDVYVRKVLMAHNGVDRDNERFPASLLADFAETFPGRSFLKVHDRRSLPIGLFFDAEVKDTPPEDFKTLTGEDMRLPEAEPGKTLWTWFYVIKAVSEEFIANFDGGVFRHTSIGFSASDIKVIDDKEGRIKYWEYSGPGEALEGSLVFLGAQQGATLQKNAKDNLNTGDNPMLKDLIKQLNALLGKSYDDGTPADTLIQGVKTALAEKDTKIQDLQKQIDDQKQLVETGKAYVEDLRADYARMKAALGEIEETPAAAEQAKGFVVAMPLDFLKSEVKALQKRMEQKFPDKGQLKGEHGRDKSGAGDDSLIPEEEK